MFVADRPEEREMFKQKCLVFERTLLDRTLTIDLADDWLLFYYIWSKMCWNDCKWGMDLRLEDSAADSHTSFFVTSRSH